MRFKVLVLLLIVVTFGSLGLPKVVFGSWIGFTTEEMFEQADVILIGEIKEILGEERVRIPGTPILWYTKWKVEPMYYLKGDIGDSEIVVGTPGASNKNVWTSIDYRLDIWESPVLLFLREKDGFYEPLSPQGVISVKKVGHAIVEPRYLDGYVISEEFEFDDSQMESYILENVKQVKIPVGGSKIKRHSFGIFTFLVPIFVIMLIVPFLRKLD